MTELAHTLIPDAAKIDHAVRDAVTFYRGGVSEPLYRAANLHRLNPSEWGIAARCYDQAIDALWASVSEQFRAKQFGRYPSMTAVADDGSSRIVNPEEVA